MPVINKMVYNWTEYILWWWGNIWEPLNLTVTSVWLDATITWEDNEIWTIPPTTFQKSELVRKIGSAPTSPSDWVLVVTETVKDTYKVSWYVDQWLTGWETYYYRVFSYSDLGGISYCDAEDVTISATPYPTSWLIGYYSFENDTDNDTVLHDESWLWNNGVRDSSYGSIVTGWKVWTNCLYKSTNNKNPWKVVRSSSFNYTTEVSFMGWIKTTNGSYCCGLWWFFDWVAPYANQRSIALRWDNDITLLVWALNWGDGLEVDTAATGDGWVWTHYAVTWGWANDTVKVYRNGVEVYSNDLGYFFSGNSPFYFLGVDWGWWWAGYCDDVLVYNRVLTDQEISDYYTATA